MTQLELLFRALDGVPVARPAWTADISYWVAGRSPGEIQSMGFDTEEGYLELCKRLRCMPYYWYEDFWVHRREYPDETVSSARVGDVYTTTWKCRRGEIVQVEHISRQSSSRAVVKHAVESAGDLRILIDLMSESTVVESAALETYHARVDRWARYDGIPAIGLPRSPLSSLITEWAGVERAVYLLMDEPDLITEFFSVLERQERSIVEACGRVGVRIVHFPDNLTSEVYTSFFEPYMRGPYERRLEALHSYGVSAAVHLDGTVRGLLPLLASVGMDAVEAVTPAPVGDVPVDEMRSLCGSERLALWGGVPGAMFARPYDWPSMKSHVEKVLDAWSGRPFVLGVADQVPPDGDIEMVTRIAELVEARY